MALGSVWISSERILLDISSRSYIRKEDFIPAHDQSKEDALETIRRLARRFPRGFKFRREEPTSVIPLFDTIRAIRRQMVGNPGPPNIA